MPRTARVVLPGYPHHIIQRGHNRSKVFIREADYLFYLRTLIEWKRHLSCKVYAFCLMTNHVHLLVEPTQDPASLGLLMKRVAGRFTRYINRVESRTGTVWNGRFNSSPIDTNAYLMACYRYVELNPVRAGMVPSPINYRWSSYRHHATSPELPWLDEHSLYSTLGATPTERRQRYSEWIRASTADQEVDLIRAAVHRGQLTGDSSFREAVEHRVGLRVDRRGPGRPQQVTIRK